MTNCCMISSEKSKEYVPSCLDCNATVYPCENQSKLTCGQNGLCKWENDVCKRVYPYKSVQVSRSLCPPINCNTVNKKNTIYNNSSTQSSMQSSEADGPRELNITNMYKIAYEKQLRYVFAALFIVFTLLIVLLWIFQIYYY